MKRQVPHVVYPGDELTLILTRKLTKELEINDVDGPVARFPGRDRVVLSTEICPDKAAHRKNADPLADLDRMVLAINRHFGGCFIPLHLQEIPDTARFYENPDHNRRAIAARAQRDADWAFMRKRTRALLSELADD